MDARRSFVAANAMIVALRRGDEAKAVGFIDSVQGAIHLGLCLLSACDTGHPTCTKLLLAAHAAVNQAGSDGNTPLIAASD
jgi:ankyrin repeat protein